MWSAKELAGERPLVGAGVSATDNPHIRTLSPTGGGHVSLRQQEKFNTISTPPPQDRGNSLSNKKIFQAEAKPLAGTFKKSLYHIRIVS